MHDTRHRDRPPAAPPSPAASAPPNASEQRLTDILDGIGEAFYAVDHDWRLTVFNRECERHFGRLRDDVLGRVLWDVFPGSAATDLGRRFRDVMSGRRLVTFEAKSIILPGRWMEFRLFPTSDGMGVTFRDISERKRVEEVLRESARRLDAVLNNASVAIFLMDDRQQCVYMNAAAEKLTGYTLAETQGRPLHDVVHHTRPDGSHYPLEECPIDRAFPENNQEQGEEVFVHKDGSFYPVAFTASPIRDENAAVVGTIIEVRDITAEKAAQRHQQLLINELNHRVKNTLATVQSVAVQTLRSAPTLEQAREAFESRLIALSRAHDVLTRENWEGAGLREIVLQALEPYGGDGENRFHIQGPEVRLTPRMALALAMALQELATNAAKYGALSNRTGEVRIGWMIDATAQPRLRLRWEERGGPPVEAPRRRGFGSRLIERGLAQDLGGEARIDFAPSGVVCTVNAPAA